MDAKNNFSKRKEKELEEDTIVLEMAIKNFWEILPIPVCTTSPTFIILETGKGFDVLFGYVKNELAGESLKEMAFDGDNFKKILDKLFQQRKISNIEATLQNKKGEKISVLVSAIAQEDKRGEVFSYLFSFVDVTLIKETERKLQEQIKDSMRNAQELTESKKALMNILEDVEKERKKAELERDKTLALIHNFADGLLFFEKGKLTLFNPQAAKTFAMNRSFKRNQSVAALSENAKLKPLVELLQNSHFKAFRQELRLAENLILEVSSIEVPQEDGEKGVMVVLHDVTREKFVEKMKTDFVTIAAHQLRTPLSAIKWTLSMLLSTSGLGAEQQDFVNKAYASNERIINLVNDLLNVTKIEEGKFISELEKTDMASVIRQAINDMKNLAAAKNLKTEFLTSSGVPLANIDKDKILLAVGNLLENAIRYTRDGQITLELGFDKEKEELVFSITDTGIGIPKDQQERVFSRFFRAPNALKVETEGSGLGLYIVKNIIEAHGGRIWFKSEPDKGSTFYFAIPR
ncbi:MAG: ATP-binding protein [Patescibacteria group bacterium]|nr:ATP-binding protein [Patescibacteria group bacterium]